MACDGGERTLPSPDTQCLGKAGGCTSLDLTPQVIVGDGVTNSTAPSTRSSGPCWGPTLWQAHGPHVSLSYGGGRPLTISAGVPPTPF